MNDVDRRKKSIRAHWRNGVALAALLSLPGVARAQSYSPGNLVTATPPSLNDSREPTSILGTVAQSLSRGGAAAGTAVANPPDFQYSAFADLSGLYTTNAQGAPHGSSDFDTRGLVNFIATENTLRLNAVLNYAGSVDYFANNSSATIFSNNLNASVMAEVVPDHLILSTAIFASPQNASGLGNVAASGTVLPAGANGDVRNTYGFVASPDLFFRLGDFLRSDSMPSYNEVFLDRQAGANPGLVGNVASNIATGAFTQKFTSGDDFTRLQWSAVGNYTQMSHSASDLTQRSATGELSYAIVHGIDVIADGGYQTVKADVPLSKMLSGPVILGGMRFDTAHITGQFRVGEQYRGLSVTGNLAYMITPVISLLANASDNVTTAGAGLVDPTSLLNTIGSALSSGQLAIPSSGALNLTGSELAGIGLQTTPSRIQTQSVGVQYRLDKLTATLSAYSTTQTNVLGNSPGQNGTLRSLGLTPSVSYIFSDDLTGEADFAYTSQTLLVGHSNTSEFHVRSNYSINDLTQFYAEADYFQRDSGKSLAALSGSSGSFSSEYLRLGIRRQF